MKLQFLIEALTKILTKNIYFYDMTLRWHQRGQYEHKFHKMIIFILFYFSIHGHFDPKTPWFVPFV